MPTINPIAAVVSGPCLTCGQPTAQCAECAVSVEVDPVSNLPIDVVLDPQTRQPVTVPRDRIAPEIAARAVQRMICDHCVHRMIALGKQMTTATDRHARGRCANAGLL